MQGYSKGRVHHEFREARGGLVEGLGCCAKKLQVVVIFQHRKFVAQERNLGAFLGGEFLPGGMRRRLVDRSENGVRFVPSLD